MKPDWGSTWKPKLPKLYTLRCPKHGAYWGERKDECPHCAVTEEEDDEQRTEVLPN